jgi:hypothetical protein
MKKVVYNNIFHISGDFYQSPEFNRCNQPAQHVVNHHAHDSSSRSGARKERKHGAKGKVSERQHPVLFRFISQQAVSENRAMKVEHELFEAARGSATGLADYIRTAELIGDLDTKYLSARELYDELNSHFSLAYKYRNFVSHREGGPALPVARGEKRDGQAGGGVS